MDINFRRKRREINLLSHLLEFDVLYEHKVGLTSVLPDFSDLSKIRYDFFSHEVDMFVRPRWR